MKISKFENVLIENQNQIQMQIHIGVNGACISFAHFRIFAFAN